MDDGPPRFHHEAADELEDAVAWYAQHDADLADRFLNAVEDAGERMRLWPDAYQRIEVGYYAGEAPRRIGVYQFPFTLVYERIADGTLLIVAVSHDKREPEYWADRLFLRD